MKRLLFVFVLLAAPAWAQTDQIDVSRAGVYNSPPDLMRYPIAAALTSIQFTAVGFPVRFSRMEGPSRWPDVRTPGWDGDLQYTLGMCLEADGWACSAVVQFWHGRQDADAKATAAPGDVAKEWFYSERWGPLFGRNPVLGEVVGLFVCRGDCRANTPVDHERSNVVRVVWGQSASFPEGPGPAPPPGPSPQPPAPLPTPTLDLSTVIERLDLLAHQVAEHDSQSYAQAERIRADNVTQIGQLSAQIAGVDSRMKEHDEKAGGLSQVFGNRYVQLLMTAFGAILTTQQVTK